MLDLTEPYYLRRTSRLKIDRKVWAILTTTLVGCQENKLMIRVHGSQLLDGVIRPRDPGNQNGFAAGRHRADILLGPREGTSEVESAEFEG